MWGQAMVASSDYPPGEHALDAFKYAFEHNGGKVIDAIPGGRGAGRQATYSMVYRLNPI
jgi:hypothetical protein